MNWKPANPNPNPDPDPDDGVSRRSILAAGAAGLSVATSGCIDRVQSVVDQNETEQLSLSIVTVPVDSDRESARIARHLEENLEAVGIDTTLSTRSQSEFFETVLIDHDFDLYVGRHPADFDPDFLYEALHSTYANEAGWQNPFGFTNVAFDSSLERQRRADDEERGRHIATVLDELSQEKPFEPICIPDEYRLARDQFDNWDEDHLATRRGYLGLDSDADDEQLHALVTDASPSENVNPLSATARERGTVIDLLYDSLATYNDGEADEWLARNWEWDDGTMTVDLREDCQFHDGEPLTADDVAFTYRFLEDTTLGRASSPSPAPRYRGQVAAVDSVDVEGDGDGDDEDLDGGEDNYRLEFTFQTSEAVAERALTVPILPESVWRDTVEEYVTQSDDFSPTQGDWSIVTGDNVPPVGSGPFQFADRTEREHLTLERFDDHFTLREDVDLPEPTVEELRLEVDPGAASSVNRVTDGNADVTTSRLESHVVDEVLEADDDGETPGVQVVDDSSWTVYHVGFNTRRQPFSDLHFRRAVAQLIDKEWVVEDVFDDNARPVAAPVDEEWTPDSLEWNGEDPVTPFVGTDGELNVESARSVFASNFQYDADGNLLR